MRALISWWATNPVATNLLVGFLLLAGLASFAAISVQVNPDADPPVVTIVVPYLGAAPEEVETAVCARIDEQLDGVDGIDRIQSTAAEGSCQVRANLLFDADRDAVLAEIQNKINAIDTFPAETETPVVQLYTLSDMAVEVAVVGPSDERALKELAHHVRADLLALPGVTQVAVVNVRPYEISVEVSEASLKRNNLTFDQVAEAIRQNSVDLPGGTLRTERGDLLLRTDGQAYGATELDALMVTTRSDGAQVRLGDVARVADGFADTGQRLRFDGRPAALVRISQVGSQDLREITEQVRRYVAESRGRYPEGVQLTVWNDQSVMVEDRLSTLLDSGLMGLLLVLIVLALFLRPHLALWVAAGIPIALFGAVFLLFWLDVSIDRISLVGFILVLGMLVDDAIVVGESAYVAQRQGSGHLAGAIEGAHRVLVPVTFGVLTTVAAFVPILLMPGYIGQFLSGLAAVVICCLALSLVECLMVLPMHLGQRAESMPLGEFGIALLAVLGLAAFAFAPDSRTGVALAIGVAALVFAAHQAGVLRRVGVAFAAAQVRFEDGLQAFIDGPFRRIVQGALGRCTLTITAGAVALGLAVAAVIGGHLPFSFLTADQGDRVVARLTMPAGTPQHATDRLVARMAAAARRVQEGLAGEYGEPVVIHVVESYGAHLGAGALAGDATIGSELAEVFLQLAPAEQRSITTNEVADAWRNAIGPLSRAVQVDFVTESGTVTPDIHVRFFGDRLEDLTGASNALASRLAEYPGMWETAISFRDGKEQLTLSLTDAGAALGLTLADLGRQVRQAYYGEEAQRVQRGEEDVRIMVRYPAEARQTLASLDALHVRTPTGSTVPFRTVARTEWGRGASVIDRVDGVRSVNVTARVDPAQTSAAAIVADLRAFLDDTVAAYPGLGYEIESDRQTRETTAQAGPLFLAALFAIFALLAIPLRSYFQPLIIMAALPFCFVGAVVGHLVLMVPGIVTGFSVPSAFGLLAAGGVAINATLVLLHGARRFRADGDSVAVALENAAVSRCRPILITTATTFIGLLPLMLSRNPAVAQTSPMVVSLAFGVVASSVAALLFVPALWLGLHTIATRIRRTTVRLADAAARAPRMAQWATLFPFVQDSLQSSEYTDLLIEEDEGIDAETARIARAGLVRLYYEREFDRRAMAEELAALAARAPSTDHLSAEVHTWAQQRVFQLGAHMLSGAIAPVDASGPLTDMLDAGLTELLAAVRRDFAEEHGDVADDRVALVALGSYGRREFAVGDPLRLLFLYECAPPAAASAVDAGEWHGGLLRRFMRVAGELSPKGMVFELGEPWRLALPDRRVAASLESFESYAAGEPSAGDLRALVHARALYADGDVADRFEALRQGVLARPRDARALAAALSALRPVRAQSPWDVRGVPGGLIDLALFAEHLQMAAAGSSAEILTLGLAGTFKAAGDEGLLAPAVAEELAGAAELWQNFDGFLRVAAADSDPTVLSREEQTTLAAGCGAVGFPRLGGTARGDRSAGGVACGQVGRRVDVTQREDPATMRSLRRRMNSVAPW